MGDPRRARRLIGKAANERGRVNEKRVVEALRDGRPEWLGAVRLATKAEDRRGIDVVAGTDVGDLYLQVKSSRTGARHAEPGDNVRVVISRQGDPLTTLRARALGALGSLRRVYLERRGAD